MRADDQVPDVRDGLTRVERIVLHVLREAERERGGRGVPTALLWGRVCEHVDIRPEALSAVLARLGAGAGLAAERVPGVAESAPEPGPLGEREDAGDADHERDEERGDDEGDQHEEVDEHGAGPAGGDGGDL